MREQQQARRGRQAGAGSAGKCRENNKVLPLNPQSFFASPASPGVLHPIFHPVFSVSKISVQGMCSALFFNYVHFSFPFSCGFATPFHSTQTHPFPLPCPPSQSAGTHSTHFVSSIHPRAGSSVFREENFNWNLETLVPTSTFATLKPPQALCLPFGLFLSSLAQGVGPIIQLSSASPGSFSLAFCLSVSTSLDRVGEILKTELGSGFNAIMDVYFS